MRILHVFDHSLPHQSGYVFRSLGLLRAQERRGWETVALTAPRHGPAAELIETIDARTYYRTRNGAPHLPLVRELGEMRASTRRIEEAARAARVDLIHAHSPVLNARPALAAGRRLGLPVVYEIRAFWEDAAVDHGATKEGSARYRATHAMETRACRRADHVFTICEGLRRDLVSRGLADEKVTVIPNAVDAGKFVPVGKKDEALRAQLGLGDATVLGFVGSFYHYEGIDRAIDAVARLADANVDLKLLLVGGGPEDERLRARAAPLRDRVVFTGRVPHGEVGRYYALIDLLVFPRRAMRLTELVTPLKPLEAMAQEIVCVASDVGGHKELIADDETGYLFPADDAPALAARLVEVLNDRPRWPAIRAAGRRFVEAERTWDASASRYADVYQRLTAAA